MPVIAFHLELFVAHLQLAGLAEAEIIVDTGLQVAQQVDAGTGIEGRVASLQPEVVIDELAERLLPMFQPN